MRGLLFLFLTFLSFQSFAHQYYFGFAEVKYNAVSKKIEASIQLTGHDFEKAFLQEKGKKIVLENLSANDKLEITTFLNQGFKFFSSEESSYFHLIGIELDRKGTVTFHIQSDPIDLFESVKCQFKLLMKTFHHQQNKMTFIYKDQKSTYEFLPAKITRIIKF